MLVLKWPSHDRQAGRLCRPVLIEMKYGDTAMSGTSGVLKHLEQMQQVLAHRDKREALSRMIVSQFNQLTALGLMEFNQGQEFKRNGGFVRLDPDVNPEIVFLLANHNPRSSVLLRELEELDAVRETWKAANFELRFFVASFAGYAMHDASMLNLDQFKEFVKLLLEPTRGRRTTASP